MEDQKNYSPSYSPIGTGGLLGTWKKMWEAWNFQLLECVGKGEVMVGEVWKTVSAGEMARRTGQQSRREEGQAGTHQHFE